MRYGDPGCAHGASTRYAPRSRIRLPLPTFGGPALRAVYSRKVWPLCFASHSFCNSVGTAPPLRSRCDGDHKNALFAYWPEISGACCDLLGRRCFKQGERKCLARPLRLWPLYSFLAPSQPFWRMPITRPTIMSIRSDTQIPGARAQLDLTSGKFQGVQENVEQVMQLISAAPGARENDETPSAAL
jgi:hypothetical protein